MKKSAPQPRHQRISRKLLRLMDEFIQKNALGEVFYAPIDVFLDDENVPQPDLVFVSNARASIIDDREGILGVIQLKINSLFRRYIPEDTETLERDFGLVNADCEMSEV